MPIGTKGAKAPTLKDFPFVKQKNEDDARFKATGEFFVGMPTVTTLDENNYGDYIKDMDVCMIMYYNPKRKECYFAKKHFEVASKMNPFTKRGYGAVNCIVRPDICKEENITTLPTYIMFSRGHYVGTYRDFWTFTAETMKKYLDNCPVIKQVPRPETPCASKK